MGKSLICINTCNRLAEVKKYVLPYIDFCNKHEGYHFVLSLDGKNPEYLEFCNQFEIPLIYSEEREGVGLSKNRVLSMFPDYDHYFFIDDDVELYDSRIFEMHCSLGQSAEEYYHLASTKLFITAAEVKIEDYTIMYGLEGGGYFNYFNKKGLDKVGGWHTRFAAYKRYGHTEHSYRFYHLGMSKYPFTIIKDCVDMVILHNPVHVTAPAKDMDGDLFQVERELIAEKLKYFPVTTICKYYFNGFSVVFNKNVEDYLKANPDKYPMLSGKERSICLSSYYLFLSTISKNGLVKFRYFCNAWFLYLNNPEIKHLVKRKLKLV